MPQHRINRMWTLLLTLTLGVAGLSALTHVAHAVTGNGGWQGDGSGEIDPPPPPPTGSGDPDSPSNGGKPTTRPTVNGGRVGVFGNRGSGEAASSTVSIWEFRVRVLVHAMRAYYLRW